MSDEEAAQYGFKQLDLSTLPKAGEVVDIERPGGLFSFWHVRVEEQPMYIRNPHNLGPLWVEFRVTDGKFAQSLFYHSAYIRRVV